MIGGAIYYNSVVEGDKMKYNFQFLTGKVEGGFLAVSNVEPFFCLHAKTEKVAVDEAIKAINFYISTMIKRIGL